MDKLDGSIQTTTMSSNIPLSLPKIEFSWYDYVLFCTMLIGSVLIGIYFGFIKQQATAKDYLLGGKKMKVVPVSLSMIASTISGFSILAVPADIYKFGATYWLSGFSVIVVAIFTYKVYLPVFYNLQITSTYEYLKLRFNSTVRTTSSFLFTLNMFLFLPVTIYIPALAFTQATNIPIHLIAPIICGICIFYTTIGGLKAVVWTDAFQFTATLGAMGAIFYLGLVKTGGFANVWNVSKEGSRLDIDMDIDPTKRDTFWGVLIGLSFTWLSYIGLNQGNVQKFLSLPSLKDCKKASIIMSIGMILNKIFMVFTGLMLYVKYHDCDPIVTKRVEKPDQMVPFFVLDVAHNVPGLPGLFIAGVFCASLSALSAMLNCISGVIYQDFLEPFIPDNLSQKTISNILKLIVFVSGVISTALIFVIENMGSLFPLGMKLTGVAQGPLVGLFTLGMLFPVANSKGAMAGGLLSLSFMTWMLIGAYHYQSTGILVDISKPLTVDACPFPLNETFTNSTYIITSEDEMPFFIYRISYYYYTFLGSMITIIIGLIVSYITRKRDDPPVRRDLISPVMHFLLPKEENILQEKPYYTIEKAAELLKIEKADNEKFMNIQR